MALGGARPGAGRKKGGKNRSTIEREMRAAAGVHAAINKGLMPLDVILAVMRGEKTFEPEQVDAAIAAAPYVHARLASTVLEHKHALSDVSLDELRAWITALERVTFVDPEGAEAGAGEAASRVTH